MQKLKVPFLEVGKTYQEFKNEIDQSINKVLESGLFLLGNELKSFESSFSRYCNTKHTIGVGSGLDALIIILRALKVLGKLNSKDEVIVPANTYIATILCIIESGLKPVLIEPSIDDYNIDPQNIKQAISSKTAAIIVVHLYGQLAKMKEINQIAKDNNIIVIEDAAQSHGAINKKNIKAGNFGYAAAFSFYPGKNLGAFSDAGAITTNDDLLYETTKKIRNYGSNKKYHCEYKGLNSRLDEIQASILNIKLKYLDEHNNKRINIAKKYINNIKNDKIILPNFSFNKDHVFHLFVIRTKDRLKLVDYLDNNGIQTIIHYPIPPHKQIALKEYNHLSFSITEKIHNEVLSIPCNPYMSNDQIEKCIEALNNF